MSSDATHLGPPIASAGSSGVPLFHAAWLFAIGIALTERLWLRPSWVLVALGLVAVLCGIAALRAQRVMWLPLALLWCLLGAWVRADGAASGTRTALAGLSDGLLRTVEGTVVDAGAVRSEAAPNTDEPAFASLRNRRPSALHSASMCAFLRSRL